VSHLRVIIKILKIKKDKIPKLSSTKMIDSMIQGFSQFVNVIWMLFFLGPLYVIMSKFLAVVLQGAYVYLGKRNTFLYKYCGDLTWLLPFKVFFVISKFIKYN
jgi:hypothetical protein